MDSARRDLLVRNVTVAAEGVVNQLAVFSSKLIKFPFLIVKMLICMTFVRN